MSRHENDDEITKNLIVIDQTKKHTGRVFALLHTLSTNLYLYVIQLRLSIGPLRNPLITSFVRWENYNIVLYICRLNSLVKYENKLLMTDGKLNVS